MNISDQISKRFRYVSNISMIAVVFIHSKFILSRWDKYIDVNTNIGRLSDTIQFSISETICRLAVPLFFFISGYFIAYHNDGSLTQYKAKIKSRIQSLLVPYVLFSLGWLVVSVATGKTTITNMADFVHYLLVSPIPFQFWFLQHLMALVLLSWIIINIANRYGRIFIIGLCMLYILHYDIRGGFIGSIFFFSLGVFYCTHNCNIHKSLPSLIFFAVLCVTSVIMRFYQADSNWGDIVSKLITLCGVYAVVSWIFKSSYNPSSSIISPNASFFVFATHEPLLSQLKNIYIYVFSTQFEILIGYFVIPIITILLCLGGYKVLMSINNNFGLILTGNR